MRGVVGTQRGAERHMGDTPSVSEQLRDHWRTSSRQLPGHGRREAAASLARVQALVDTWEGSPTDLYGDGGVVAVLEEEARDLLGTEAALFLPSGTMAQQAVLRVHAERSGSRTIAWHPRCHLDLWEDQAATHLHGLVSRPVGDADRIMARDDLDEVHEPLGAVLWELPQRELGGILPDWDDLVAQVEWARDQGIATHLDGARLWTTTAHYGRDLATIAGLFDTVYVSFYKDLGAWAGCVLAGPRDVVDEVAVWRHRHGGTLYALWPYAAAALDGLRTHLPRIPDYVSHARAIAAALDDLDGVRVVPNPPHTSMFHIWLDQDADEVGRRLLANATRTDLATWAGAEAGPVPGWSVLELSVGAATLEFTPDRVRDILAALVRPRD